MSLALSIQFLSGRYHATPWNHQVNEGMVEWPPSPWRLLRSLVSAYYHLPSPPDRTLMNQLLTHLANHPPNYVLPECTPAHTRHYMPIWKEGKVTTTKVFDTFLVLPGGALSTEATVQVVWSEVQLSPPDQELLQHLCGQISYLGRAESWVEIKVVSEAKDCNATPLGATATPGSRRVKVLASLTTEGLVRFQAAISSLPKPQKGRVAGSAPVDILAALELNIADLHKHGWNGIPGARWITYELKPADNFQTVRSPKRLPALPTLARFALAANVLPKLTQAVSVGERFHQALTVWSKDETGQVDPIFSGRNLNEVDEMGQAKPAKGQQHAWYLPEVNQAGEIDHVVVYAAGGFQAQAVSALSRLPKVWGTEGFDLQTILVSLGNAEMYREAYRHRSGQRSLVGRSRYWHPLTPMVLPRHTKRKFIAGTNFHVDGPEHQALRLLNQLLRDLKQDLSLEDCVVVQYPGDAKGDWLGYARHNGEHNGEILVKTRCVDRGVSRFRWQAFQRRRYCGNGEKQSDFAYWLELEFAEPQSGPIALGYAAHYGLGLFVPLADVGR